LLDAMVKPHNALEAMTGSIQQQLTVMTSQYAQRTHQDARRRQLAGDSDTGSNVPLERNPTRTKADFDLMRRVRGMVSRVRVRVRVMVTVSL